jgi:hypothetical protein
MLGNNSSGMFKQQISINLPFKSAQVTGVYCDYQPNAIIIITHLGSWQRERDRETEGEREEEKEKERGWGGYMHTILPFPGGNTCR